MSELLKDVCLHDDNGEGGCWECFDNIKAQLQAEKAKNERLRKVVNEQAGDEGLWFIAASAPEAYLQQALRKLHEIIEGKTQRECAEKALSASGGKDE